MSESSDTEGEAGFAIAIISLHERYWLVVGEEHLDDLLYARPGYPTPVACLTYPDADALNADMPEGTTLMDLWKIHPGVIERLRSDDEIVDLRPGP